MSTTLLRAAADNVAKQKDADWEKILSYVNDDFLVGNVVQYIRFGWADREAAALRLAVSLLVVKKELELRLQAALVASPPPIRIPLKDFEHCAELPKTIPGLREAVTQLEALKTDKNGELVPNACPFCGGKPYQRETYARIHIGCVDCMVEMNQPCQPSTHVLDKNKLIHKWNNRRITTDIKARKTPMTKQTKKAAMYDRIQRHGENLNAIFQTDKEPIALCKALHRIETAHSAVATRYCNGDMSSEQYEKFAEGTLKKLVKLLGDTIPFHINGDPRGYALKIPDTYVREHGLKIYTDWGGYGILAPDLAED